MISSILAASLLVTKSFKLYYQQFFLKPYQEYKEVHYLWNIDEVSNVVCLVDLVHVQFAPDKLFLFVPFFEQTLFLELFSASEYLIIKIS